MVMGWLLAVGHCPVGNCPVGHCPVGAERHHCAFWRAPTLTLAGASAFRVQIQLVADDFFVDAVGEVFSQAVGEGQEQVVYALFIEDSCEDPTSLPAIVLAQELADLLHGDIALEIQVEILE